MKKEFKSSIRINGRQQRSPSFNTKRDLDAWLDEKKRLKKFLKSGTMPPINNKTTVEEYVLTKWIPDRINVGYPKSTIDSDTQRFRDYIQPLIGSFKVSDINQIQIRAILRNVVEKHGLSRETRNRVRSLMSKIFNDAMNEEPPLRHDNPAMNISFVESREGKKEPPHLKREKDILKFLSTAKKFGPKHLVYACLALMTGLRKQEIIALRWNDLDIDNKLLVVDEKFIQAENAVMAGTKAGVKVTREVPLPDELIEVLLRFKKASDWQGDDDFILANHDGGFCPSKQLWQMNDDISKASGISINTHGLRHTFGRQFVLKTGDKAALQTILGHSNSQTTDIYSKLAGRMVTKHRNVVSYKIGEEDED